MERNKLKSPVYVLKNNKRIEGSKISFENLAQSFFDNHYEKALQRQRMKEFKDKIFYFRLGILNRFRSIKRIFSLPSRLKRTYAREWFYEICDFIAIKNEISFKDSFPKPEDYESHLFPCGWCGERNDEWEDVHYPYECISIFDRDRQGLNSSLVVCGKCRDKLKNVKKRKLRFIEVLISCGL